MRNKKEAPAKTSIGVSSCLLGNPVRYDGTDRRVEWIANQLASEFDLVAICPELEAGFGVPREPVVLVLKFGSIRMLGRESGVDQTDRMFDYIEQRLSQDDINNLAGFILKARSPSCGGDSVKLFSIPDNYQRQGTGLFVKALQDRFPNLPIIDEKQLDDQNLRETFFFQVRQHELNRK